MQRAFVELAESATRSARDKTYVIVLLEEMARHARTRTVASVMPDEERAMWERAGADFSNGEQALARSAAATASAFADLLERSVAGDEAAAKLLDVDRSRISQRLAERSLYAVNYGDERYFPRWQFARDKVLRGLKTVLTALDPKLHPLTVDHFFTTPSLELLGSDEPLSPAAWLATGGDIGAVAELAADL
ncbi:MAG TPA: hypothetical protein VF230_00965 [Acidimicrobiales bacterium]